MLLVTGSTYVLLLSSKPHGDDQEELHGIDRRKRACEIRITDSSYAKEERCVFVFRHRPRQPQSRTAE